MIKEEQIREDEKMLKIFLEACISSGRVIKTEGFESLSDKTICKIETFLNNHSDQKAEKKIRELLS